MRYNSIVKPYDSSNGFHCRDGLSLYVKHNPGCPIRVKLDKERTSLTCQVLGLKRKKFFNLFGPTEYVICDDTDDISDQNNPFYLFTFIAKAGNYQSFNLSSGGKFFFPESYRVLHSNTSWKLKNDQFLGFVAQVHAENEWLPKGLNFYYYDTNNRLYHCRVEPGMGSFFTVELCHPVGSKLIQTLDYESIRGLLSDAEGRELAKQTYHHEADARELAKVQAFAQRRAKMLRGGKQL